jgi:hypothetical protein
VCTYALTDDPKRTCDKYEFGIEISRALKPMDYYLKDPDNCELPDEGTQPRARHRFTCDGLACFVAEEVRLKG